MMQRVVKRAAEHTRYRHACARISDAAVMCDASVLELHKTPAVVDNVNTKSDRQVCEMSGG